MGSNKLNKTILDPRSCIDVSRLCVCGWGIGIRDKGGKGLKKIREVGERVKITLGDIRQEGNNLGADP
jgi:hypothetical protein